MHLCTRPWRSRPSYTYKPLATVHQLQFDKMQTLRYETIYSLHEKLLPYCSYIVLEAQLVLFDECIDKELASTEDYTSVI